MMNLVANDRPTSVMVMHVQSAVFLLLAVAVCGCGEDLPNGPRSATSPVIGQVLVDGQPAANLRVKCYPAGAKAGEERLDGLPTPSAFTDQEGRFEINTYETGDGAPPGEYQLTFMWGQYGLMSGQYEGPDKLKKKYLDPETSEYLVVVVEGLPTDLGTIELSTAD